MTLTGPLETKIQTSLQNVPVETPEGISAWARGEMESTA